MEKITRPPSGWLMLFIALALLGVAVALFVNAGDTAWMHVLGAISTLTAIIIMVGFIALEPNHSRVLILFGKYVGSVKNSGFSWVNPFYIKKGVSLRANNLDTKPIKVNDKHGNPILIGAVVVWQVADTYKALFDVGNYGSFVITQSEAAIRKLAGAFSYDNFEAEGEEITLRSSANEVSELLEKEISERLLMAGIHVIEARISHLAYAEEIAGAMLQRQQATAVVAARAKIVEGAVGMVEMALHELSKKSIVTLDEERKAQMVSNLMLVLCGDKNAQPVINAGSIYQ